MPNLFFWSTATKAKKLSMLSLAPTPFPNDSKANHDSQKHLKSSLELEDESPTGHPTTPPHLFGRFSPESPESNDSGRSCSPGTMLEGEGSPSRIRRIYIVTNADDRDAELTQRYILPKSTSSDSGRVRRSSESQSPRDNPPISDVLPLRPEPTLPHGWERRRTRNGRIFYIDHNTRTTSFHPPLIEPELEQSPDDLGPLPPWWEMTVLNDGRVVFLDHKTQTTTLRDPRKTKLEETPLAQFIRKSLYLQRKLRHERLPGHFEIKVRKSHVFEDSFTFISNAAIDDLRRGPVVVLDGLQPVHHSIRQWSELLFDVAFDPNSGLFQSGDNGSLNISHYSSQTTCFLPYFKFLGRLHGLCVLHNFPINPKMVPLFYPLMNEQAANKRPGRARGDSLIPAVIEDPTAACTIYNQGNGKLLLRSCNILDERTGQLFSVEIKRDNNGFTFSNEEDRNTFAAGFSAHRGALDPNLVLEPFMDGFWEIIRNKGLLRGYTQPEVRRLIGGVSEIDWEQHSEPLTGNQEDERLEWFWKIVKTWPLEYREALLRYTTGFKRVPATDKFKVFRTPHGTNHFSHFSVHAVQERAASVQREDEATLVHVLLVPNFSTYEELEVNLLHTICNCDPEPIVIEGYAEFVFG